MTAAPSEGSSSSPPSSGSAGDPGELATVLGRLPSGLYILTIRHDDQETGMLASWVMQAGFTPPSLTVAVRHGRYLSQWLEAGSPFALHLLSGQNKNLLSHFGRGFEPGQPAFVNLPLARSDRQVPLLTDTLGYLECRAQAFIDSGDHRIFLAEILSGRLQRDEPPLVHLRSSGLRY